MNIFIAEFIGTLLLILLGNGSVANVLLTRSKGEASGWIVITAGWGFAVAVAVYAVGWVSGAHLNPAVTLGLWFIGKTPSGLVSSYVAGQLLGAAAGAALVWITYLPHWAKTDRPDLKLMCFCTKPAIHRPAANLVTEIIATAVLLFGILAMLNPHAQMSMGFVPYAIGILIFGIGLSLGGPTGFAINPARDLAPRLMHAWLPIPGKGSSEWSYAWVPVVGPLLGGLLGAWGYRLIFGA